MKPCKIIINKGNKSELHPDILSIYPFSDIKWTDEYKKWLLVIHYLLYPYPEDNPFFYISELDKDNHIIKRLKLKPENKPEWYNDIYEYVKQMYETPMMKLLRTYKTTIDKMSKYIEEIQVDDKNFKNLTSYVKEFETVREGYKRVQKDVEEEINYKSRGNTKIAYDIK